MNPRYLARGNEVWDLALNAMAVRCADSSRAIADASLMSLADQRSVAAFVQRGKEREKLERFAKAMYERGVRDGLKHGPIVTKWDIPPHLLDDFIKDAQSAALSVPVGGRDSRVVSR